MARTKKTTTGILTNDVDDTSNQVPGKIEAVEGGAMLAGDAVPVPEDTGKSLAALIGSWVAGAVLSLAVSKGFFTEAQSAQFMPILQGIIILAVAWVTTRFLKSRSEVKVEALKSHAAVMGASGARGGAILGTASALPMGGFSISSVLVALTTAQMLLGFMPGSAKKKAVVTKALAAAIAAITEFQKNPS